MVYGEKTIYDSVGNIGDGGGGGENDVGNIGDGGGGGENDVGNIGDGGGGGGENDVDLTKKN